MRFSRWHKTGVWQRLLDAVSAATPIWKKSLSTAQPSVAICMPRALPKKRHSGIGPLSWRLRNEDSPDRRRLGQSAEVPAHAAQEADITQAHALLHSIATPAAVIADKGYDADAFVQPIADTGAQAVIPPRSNRHQPRSWDTHRYRARHLIENLFACLKQFRRLAIRYDKLASHFAAFVILACTCVWMA